MMRMRRMLALSMAVTMLAVTTGCSKGSGDSQKTDAGAAADKTTAAKAADAGFQTTYGDKQFDNVTITVEVFDRSNAPEGSTVIDNKWVDYINAEMNEVGITVKFIAVPRSEEVNKVQFMMASGTGPDVMLCYNSSIVEGFYNDGGTYDLAPYIDGEGQARNLKDYLGQECLDAGRNEEGVQWAVPARRSTSAASNIFIRKDWLDDLGLEIPTTIDEMYEVLKAFKEKNPDNVRDVVASGFATCKKAGDPPSVMSYAFLESIGDEKQFNIFAGSAADLIYKDPGFGEYFRWINKLYNEGLMDSEYYAANDNGLKEDFVNGKIGCFESNVNYNVDSMRDSLLQTLRLTDPEADVISIPPMKNINDGQIYNNNYPINGAFVFVPKTSQNVEAAITYLDWMATQEGGFTLFHGMEGEHFEYDENGVPSVLDSEYNAMDKDWIRHDLFIIGNQGYYKSEEEFAQATSKEAPGYEDYVVENYKNASAGIVRRDPTYTSPAFTDKNTEISVTREEYFVKLVTCKPEQFDTILGEFIIKLEKIGYDQIIDERAEFYNK